MILNLPPEWQKLLSKWPTSEQPAGESASWIVDVAVDSGLPKPDHPFFEAKPVFRGSICTLALPGFSGVIDSEHQKACLHAHPAAKPADIFYFLRAVMAVVLFHQGNLLVHASGVITDAGATLFVGHSGSGKSTIASLAGSRMVLNDDLISVQRHDNGWSASALPGEDAYPTAYPLTRILLLDHASHNYLSPVSPAIAQAELVANSPIVNAAPSYVSQLFGFWRSLLISVSLQRLHFKPDRSFWEVIDAYPG